MSQGSLIGDATVVLALDGPHELNPCLSQEGLGDQFQAEKALQLELEERHLTPRENTPRGCAPDCFGCR